MITQNQLTQALEEAEPQRTSQVDPKMSDLWISLRHSLQKNNHLSEMSKRMREQIKELHG